MNQEALIIFIKNPELGKVKTRLAATIGNEKALEIYRLLQAHTNRITRSLSQDTWLFYSNKVDSNDSWDNNLYHKKVQCGGDLGTKMLNAFRHCFDLGYQKVCIIGSDLMDINESIIQKAFNKLRDHDAVIGPALDGGYYLLGMNQLHPSLFNKKEWSTESVLKDTMSDLKKDNLSHSTLEVLNDIDTESDWNAYLSNQ